MYKNFNFESTQSRGTRILKALGDLTWGEMPEDGIFLKELETPVVAKEDTPPVQKPNIKSTLRQFWELREESCDDENSNLSRKVRDMEIEKPKVVEEPQVQMEPVPMEVQSKKQTPVDEFENSTHYVEPPQPSTERKNVKIVRRLDQDPHHHRPNTQSQLTQQNADYLSKLQKAMPEPKLVKGKTKHSQKYNYNPSSSTFTFIDKKKKADLTTQISQFSAINEDIDDLEDIHDDEPYRKQGIKKLRLEIDVETTRREEAHKMIDVMDGKDSLRDKADGNMRDRGLQDTLDKAVRRGSNQSVTRWLIKVVSYKTSKGIHTVEFLCVSPAHPDGNTSSYAVINPGKQYYVQNIVPEKRYYFVNPRPIVQQEINSKKVYYVDKIEEVVQ